MRRKSKYRTVIDVTNDDRPKGTQKSGFFSQNMGMLAKGIGVAIVLSAIVTKPAVEELKTKIQDEFRTALSESKITPKDTLIAGFLKKGCTTYIDQCVDLFMLNVDIAEGRDWILLHFASVDFDDDAKNTCLGVFGLWHCWQDQS